MATLRLHSGPVGTFDYPDAPVYGDAVVVGGPPQWDDASDATYAEATGIPGTDPSSPYAEIDEMPEALALTSATITIRYKTAYPSGTLTSGAPRMFYYEFRSEHLSTVPEAHRQPTDGPGHPVVPNDNLVHEFTYSVFPAPWMSPTDEAYWEPIWRELLTGGVLVNVFANGNPGSRPTTVTVYELWMDVKYDPAVTAVRVLRQYPRDDAYGFGGVARNYPPARRGRNYGQQP